MRVRCGTYLVRQKESSRRTHVNIVRIQGALIKGREPVQQCPRGTKLEDRLGEVLDAIVRAVAGDDVNVAIRISGWTCAAIPNRRAVAPAGIRGYPNELLNQSCSVITKQPALPWAAVSVRTDADVNGAVVEQQSRPVEMA